MRVPHTDLQPETLTNLIETFVAREGTDYGAVERSMESKIQDVLRQLEDGTAFVTYDEASDSVSIVAKDAPPPAAPEEKPVYATRIASRTQDEQRQSFRNDEDYSQDADANYDG